MNDVLHPQFFYQILRKIEAKKVQRFFYSNIFRNIDDIARLIRFQNDDNLHH